MPAKCPTCGKPTVPEHKPFCSRGCRDRDLLKWFGEEHCIPGRSLEDGGVDSEESRD